MINRSIMLLLVTLFWECQAPYQPEVIGHRGARGHVAENTLPSIQKAIDLGVDAIEIDIFRCASGELVVFHDKTLEKLTDADGYIEQYTLDSLRLVNVLGGYQIPTLREVLDLIDGQVRLNIELKGSQTAPLTHEVLQDYLDVPGTNWSAEKLFISSFDWDELRTFYQHNREIPIAILTEDDPLDALPVAQELRAFAINPDYKTLNASNVAKIYAAGLALYPWTVNAPEAIKQMKALRVSGIITDYPERVTASENR